MTIKKIISLEKEEKFDEAIIELDKLIKLERNSIKKKFYQDYIKRYVERLEAMNPFEDLQTNQIFDKYKILNHDKDAPIISLTAISGRSKNLLKTIRSITNQTLCPYSVNLFISEDAFLVDEGFDLNDAYLESIYEMGINVFSTKNLGPYRKQLPIIKYLRQQNYSEDTIIITIDDDVIYPNKTVEILVENLKKTNSVTAYRGREILLAQKRIDTYKAFRPPENRTSLFNLGTGKNGIAYKLKFFPRQSEQYIGTLLAPTADDIWCKWITGSYCINTTIIEPTAAYDKTKDFLETSPDDKVGLFHVFNAKGRNDIAINALEIFYREKSKNIFSILDELEK